MDTTDVLAKQGELVQALEALRSANNYDASYIMITNILDESTTLLFSGDVEAVVTKAFEKKLKTMAYSCQILCLVKTNPYHQFLVL